MITNITNLVMKKLPFLNLDTEKSELEMDILYCRALYVTGNITRSLIITCIEESVEHVCSKSCKLTFGPTEEELNSMTYHTRVMQIGCNKLLPPGYHYLMGVIGIQ